MNIVDLPFFKGLRKKRKGKLLSHELIFVEKILRGKIYSFTHYVYHCKNCNYIFRINNKCGVVYIFHADLRRGLKLSIYTSCREIIMLDLFL